jgi:hypothetical protein
MIHTPSHFPLVALQLVLPRQWEDPAVDWLLGHPDAYEEFDLQAVASHAAASRSPLIHEQVQGFSEGIWLHVLATAEQLLLLQDGLLNALGGSGGRWWVSPVLASGRLEGGAA